MNLSERMRWQETPPSWAAVATALAGRAALLGQLGAAVEALPAGELRDCLCALADAAVAAQAAGWDGTNHGPGGPPSGGGPGDGTNPGGWDDPNADPTTLLYECHVFTQWELTNTTTEGDSYYEINMQDEDFPPSIGSGLGQRELVLSGGRWYAITPMNWPNGHEIMFPTFAGEVESNPFAVGAGESETAYFFEPDTSSSIFDLTLKTQNPPPGGTGYRLCAAIPGP